MSLKIKVYVDFVCPYCYLAEFVLDEAIQGRDVEVEWLPFELRPAPQVTLRPEEDYLQRTWLLSVYPTAKKMGVPIVLPRISPQPHTAPAWEGFQYAAQHGKANDFYRRVQRAFFQEEQDIAKLSVLTRLAGELGLDEKDFKHQLETHAFQEAHQHALKEARMQAKVASVPTFFIGNQKLVGLPQRTALQRAIDRELNRPKPEKRPLVSFAPPLVEREIR
jgi:predicted DsbA family dithiol-disulfide isomerase